jgi:membrane-associated phospholipid phosphatase
MQRELRLTGRLWLLGGAASIVLWASLFVFPATGDWWTRQDNAFLQRLVELRSDGLNTVADAVAVLGQPWFLRVLRIGTLLALIFVRRWRHFIAVVLAVLLVGGVIDGVREAVGRPRPFVPIIGSWEGPSHPSTEVAALGVTLTAIAYVLVPRGRWRRYALAATGVLLVVLSFALMYHGVNHPTDAVIAAVFSVAVTVVLFRWFAPEAVFPVTFRRGIAAHLDVRGARGEAISRAVRDQLGLEVLSIEPFGQEGSGGSTPLRLEVRGDPNQYVFAKLYSQTHLRSDRWYKVARTILYGSLEDEVRFTSVRRLVEYEDYIQRLMRDAGVPGAKPFGIVELSPEHEYLMVSEFLVGSEELTHAEIDDHAIDSALQVIRCMWDSGLAHRDIKPANVMLNDGQVVVIDVAFGTVRPSPWRQAVDLANMMVILGLRVGAQRVYDRALLLFAPEDIGEAFAATRSVTLPSQSRSSLALLKRERGVDLVEEFRRLAPPTEPITIQRWSPRRIWLTLAALLVVLFIVALAVQEAVGAGFL